MRKKHINLNIPIIFNIQISVENFGVLREYMWGLVMLGWKVEKIYFSLYIFNTILCIQNIDYNYYNVKTIANTLGRVVSRHYILSNEIIKVERLKYSMIFKNLLSNVLRMSPFSPLNSMIFIVSEITANFSLSTFLVIKLH